MRVPLSDDARLEAARTQVRVLLAACRRFDEGDHDEHLLVATKLRVLLHHFPKRRSHAALEPFGVLTNNWHVASGADSTPENYLPEAKLLTIRPWGPRFGEFGAAPPLPWQLQVRYLANERTKPRGGGRNRPFDDWWNQTVLRDANRVEFSRAELVSNIANQDGGAHVDPTLDVSHFALTREHSFGLSLGSEPLPPVPATIRQIGWEVHSMLWEHLPELLPDGEAAPPDKRI